MTDKKVWSVYIIQTDSGKLYTGICKDINKRFRQHLGEIKGGAKFFRSDPPALLVYQENKLTHSEALKRELKIKTLKKADKLQLISI